ncbi:type IV secretion system protein VirB10 [Vibrio harveyi]|uniref:type IV secretion system protein VirB10 n=1 Tax=Vibrio harveyi TaxID=669 RepID=UPI003CEDB441
MSENNRIPPISAKGRDAGLKVGSIEKSVSIVKKFIFFGVAIVAFMGAAYIALLNIPTQFGSSESDLGLESDNNYQEGAAPVDVTEDDISDFLEENNQEETSLEVKDEQQISNQTKPPQSQQTSTRTPTTQPVVVTSTQPTKPEVIPPTPEELALARKLSGTPSLNDKGSSMPALPDLDSVQPNTDLDTPDYAPGSASVSKRGYLDFLLQHGTFVPCALYTQVISEHSGYVTCRVTQDVYSANGTALLIERGSLVSGTQNTTMERGQGRVFTNWSTIDTPNGVTVKIDSLGTGALGAAGIDAEVEEHYWKRFGGAIMLSFVDDALATASNLAKPDSDVEFDNSSDNVSDMASKALDESINIPPTGYAHIGQRINILVVRDIDMSSVYQFN